MKKNDLFIDVSSHNGYDITGILSDMGTQNTIIKVSESTNYLNPCLSAQVEQSNPVGFYHFAWFGGDIEEAEREARYFLDNVPQKVKYLCLDYEDHASGDKQANTDACIRFMEILKENGYEPIYYSYKPFTLNNIYYEQILAKFPNSLWIAGYGLNDGTANFEYFPSMDGIRWWQYSSNPYDKNIVLLDDEEAKPKWKRNETGWWYEYPNGAYPKEEWEKIDGIWYYFNERGYSIASRWLKDDGKWYYLKENGAMAIGWVFVNGKWYYLDASGAMVTGWVQYKDKLYHLKEENGAMSSEELVKVGNSERLERLHNELINKDWFMTLIDFNEYYEVKEKMLSDYENKDLWYKKVINNIAKAGFFSSDRTISQYENEIWKTKDNK